LPRPHNDLAEVLLIHTTERALPFTFSDAVALAEDGRTLVPTRWRVARTDYVQPVSGAFSYRVRPCVPAAARRSAQRRRRSRPGEHLAVRGPRNAHARHPPTPNPVRACGDVRRRVDRPVTVTEAASLSEHVENDTLVVTPV
jgi:hypothetical protein